MKRLIQFLLFLFVFLIVPTTSALATDEVIGSYRISLDQAVSPQNAVNALQAAQIINGAVVPAGDIFSYDQMVGPRDKNRGFVIGLISSTQNDIRGYGGGICMTSSILHQAVKSAGLTVLERHNHVHPTTYLPVGEDAAITRGVEDYRFKNTRTYPLVVQAFQSDNTLEVNLIEQNPDPIAIELDGKPLILDVKPLLKENRLLVPIRPIAEATGASVAWDENTKRVTFSKNEQNLELKVGSSQCQQNGQTVSLEAAPQIINGRVLVPLRLVATSMNLTVTWNAMQKKVLLSNQPTSEALPANEPITPDATDYKVKSDCWSLMYPDDNGCIDITINNYSTYANNREYSLMIGNTDTPRLHLDNKPQTDSISIQKYYGIWTPKELSLSPGTYDCRVVTWVNGEKWLSDDIRTITIKDEDHKLSFEAYPVANPDEWLVFNKSWQKGIDPVLAGRLAAFARDHKKKIYINSGFRTFEEQSKLYNDNHGIGTSQPGSSWHEYGEAIDSSSAWVKQIDNVNLSYQTELPKWGLCKPLTKGNNYSPEEDWHIQAIETAAINDVETMKSFFKSYSK